MTFDEKIADQLLTRGLISESKLLFFNSEQEKTGKSLESVLLEKGLADERTINSIKAEISHLPPADLSSSSIEPAIIELLPKKMRDYYQAAIFAKTHNEIKIGMVNPADFSAHEALEAFIERHGWRAKYYSLSLSDFNRLNRAGIDAAESEDFISDMEALSHSHSISHDSNHNDKSLDRLLALIVEYAVAGGALSAHLEGDNHSGRVRYRMGKELHHSLSYPASTHRGLIARLSKLIGGQSGKCKVSFGDRNYLLNANIMPYDSGEKAVIEMLDLSKTAKRLRYEGFSLAQLDSLSQALSRSGIILVVAQSDEARTAALYGLINELDAEKLNIMTIEAPITGRLPGVNQYAINPIIQNRAEALTAVLNHDADVIMLDEATDAETLDLAARAACRGKLIIIGIKAETINGALSELWRISGGAADFFACLNSILSVRRVRKVCRHCIEPVQASEGLINFAEAELSKVNSEFLGKDWPGLQFYRSNGCEKCGQTGQNGFALLSEIWPMPDYYKNELITALKENNEPISPSAEKYATIMQDGLIKAVYGLISAEEAIAGNH